MIDLQIYKHYNKITTKLNWKLFMRDSKGQAKKAQVWIDRVP